MMETFMPIVNHKMRQLIAFACHTSVMNSTIISFNRQKINSSSDRFVTLYKKKITMVHNIGRIEWKSIDNDGKPVQENDANDGTNQT